MTDHIAALEAAIERREFYAEVTVGKFALEDALAELQRLRAENFALAAGQCASVTGDEGGAPICEEVQRLREELAAEQARADMHADLGRRTAEALGLTDEEGRSHMPEVAGRLREQNASLVKCLFQMQEVAKVLTRQNSEMLAFIEAAQAAKERTS